MYTASVVFDLVWHMCNATKVGRTSAVLSLVSAIRSSKVQAPSFRTLVFLQVSSAAWSMNLLVHTTYTTHTQEAGLPMK